MYAAEVRLHERTPTCAASVEKHREHGNQRGARHVYGKKGEWLDGPPATSFGSL
jgi:hypothetical protein